jgi:hypothetical protein
MDGLVIAILLAGVGLLAWIAWRANFDITDAVGTLFTGWRAEAWPHGVQEEDRDRPWGAPQARPEDRPIGIPSPAPKVGPVHPSIRVR